MIRFIGDVRLLNFGESGSEDILQSCRQKILYNFLESYAWE